MVTEGKPGNSRCAHIQSTIRHTMQQLKLIKTPGMLVLAAFLVVTGLNAFIGSVIIGYVGAVLAIAAGALIATGK